MNLLYTLILRRNDRRPTSDEQRDTPPITPEACMGWLRTALLSLAALAAFVLGTIAGSVLLHTFDAEILHALVLAWDVHQRLYGAWACLYG